MYVAVTGGTGFIGVPLVDALVEAGHEVRLLTRREEPKLRPGVGCAYFDSAQPEAKGLLDEIEVVLNLAGENIGQRWTDAHKERIRASRISGTKALAEEAARAGTVRLFISGSAIGYYGPHGDEPLDESAPPGDDFLARICQAWEAAADQARQAGIRVIHPRIGMVLHPSGGGLKRMLVPFKLGLGGPMGSGDQVMSWIHRADLVALLVHLVGSRNVSGPVNATAPKPVSQRDFAQALAEALHRPAKLPTPAAALRLAFGEMASMVLDGQRVLPKKALASGFKFRFPGLPEALADLLAA